MGVIDIALLGGGACRIQERESGAELVSARAREYGGSGLGFSSTDLLAAALGSCIATNLEPVALRHGIPLEGIRLTVQKTLMVKPKRLSGLTVRIELGATVSNQVLLRLERAADRCLVHESLSPDVAVDVVLETGSSRAS